MWFSNWINLKSLLIFPHVNQSNRLLIYPLDQHGSLWFMPKTNLQMYYLQYLTSAWSLYFQIVFRRLSPRKFDLRINYRVKVALEFAWYGENISQATFTMHFIIYIHKLLHFTVFQRINDRYILRNFWQFFYWAVTLNKKNLLYMVRTRPKSIHAHKIGGAIRDSVDTEILLCVEEMKNSSWTMSFIK